MNAPAPSRGEQAEIDRFAIFEPEERLAVGLVDPDKIQDILGDALGRTGRLQFDGERYIVADALVADVQRLIAEGAATELRALAAGNSSFTADDLRTRADAMATR